MFALNLIEIDPAEQNQEVNIYINININIENNIFNLLLFYLKLTK